MRYRRDSITIYKKDVIELKSLECVGVNITQGGLVELRVNQRVVGTLPIRGADNDGRMEVRATGGTKRPDVPN